MASLSLSQHARVRMQQRGIPPRALELLLEHGGVQHDHRGGRLLLFYSIADRRARAVSRCRAPA